MHAWPLCPVSRPMSARRSVWLLWAGAASAPGSPQQAAQTCTGQQLLPSCPCSVQVRISAATNRLSRGCARPCSAVVSHGILSLARGSQSDSRAWLSHMISAQSVMTQRAQHLPVHMLLTSAQP